MHCDPPASVRGSRFLMWERERKTASSADAAGDATCNRAWMPSCLDNVKSRRDGIGSGARGAFPNHGQGSMISQALAWSTAKRIPHRFVCVLW